MPALSFCASLLEVAMIGNQEQSAWPGSSGSRIKPTDYPVIPLGPEQKELPEGRRLYWITEEKP